MISDKKYIKIISKQAQEPVSTEQSVEIRNQDITITQNGVYRAGFGYTGIGTATVNIPTGGGNIISLNVTPSTSAQTITASGGVDGYSPVKVSAVTSAIDANITAGNIKDGVTILGVTGNYSGGGGGGDSYYLKRIIERTTLKIPSDVLHIGSPAILDKYSLACAFTGVPAFNVGTINLSSVTSVTGTRACWYAFACMGKQSEGKYTLTVNFSNLRAISGNFAFERAFSRVNNEMNNLDLTANFSGLEIVSGQGVFNYAFANITYAGEKTLVFNRLTTISGLAAFTSAFAYCDLYREIDFPSLTTINNSNVFNDFARNNTALKIVNFAKLNNMSNPMCSSSFYPVFAGCTNLEDVYFGGLTSSTFASAVNQLQYLFYSTTGSAAANGTTLHFPTNFDPSNPDKTFDASTLTGYPTFGGSASYIHLAFDLPATE